MFSGKRVRRVLLSLVLLTSVGAAGLSASPAAASHATATSPSCVFPHFDPANFSDPTTIDNRWFPLVPGTRLVLTGRADRVDHRVVFIVTDLTKVINGVRTVVVWDRDYSEGELVESELHFHAQDNDGNVWSLGEYPEEYEDGQFLGAPDTWIAGLAGAEAGILVPGDPRRRTPWFVQGYEPSVEFLDCGRVVETDERTCVPAGCYSDVLVINETSPLDPESGIQQKYYAPGVGNVRIRAVGDPDGEFLRLVRIRHLGSKALAKVRREALRLDRRGYRFSEVYRQTPPAERTLDAGGSS